MSTLPPSLQAGTEVSRYRVERLVARGGMGMVYRARDVRLERPVALKVLSPELSDDAQFRDRFVRESRLAAAVDHPNVIPVYEADDWQGLLYIAMRFVDGVDLHTVLSTAGPLALEAALPILRQAAAALDAAHAAGLVHRDVKPGNLMIAGATADRVPPGAHIYLTDFGLTKRAASISGLTGTGQFLGTLAYVAPEQIRAEDVDARTDVYAFACVVYEVLTGVPPYRQENNAALLYAHLSQPPPLVTEMRPELPEAVADALVQGMAKEPTERPAGAGELVAMLDAGAAPETPRRRPAPTTVVSATAVRRGPAPRENPPQAPPPRRSSARSRSSGGGGTHRAHGRRPNWWLWLPVAAVLLVSAVVLAVWRPWAVPVLESRLLGVVPYRADVPTDWRSYTDPSGEPIAVFAPENLHVVLWDDPANLAAAAQVASEDPERLVYVYVNPATGLDEQDLDDLAGQIAASFPRGSRLEPSGSTIVAGEAAAMVAGSLRLDDGQFLEVIGAVVREKLLFLCFAPTSIHEEWHATCEAMIASIEPAD